MGSLGQRFISLVLFLGAFAFADDSWDSLLSSISQNETKLRSLGVHFLLKASPLNGEKEPKSSLSSEGDTGEFIWYMKGNKLRLDEIDSQTKKAKTRGLFDGEKYVIYFYYEDIPGEAGLSEGSGFKRGDITQVQINAINQPVR